MTGNRVLHRIYGKGTVTAERYLGNELFIEFEDGVGRWVPARELIVSETDLIKKSIQLYQKAHKIRGGKETQAPLKKPEMSSGNLPAIQTISEEFFEDLKSGLSLDTKDTFISPEKPAGTTLFEPAITKVTDEDNSQLSEQIPEPADVQAVIHELLQKTRELEQLPINIITESGTMQNKKTEKNVVISRLGINITEEAIPYKKSENCNTASETLSVESGIPVINTIIIHTHSDRRQLSSKNSQDKPSSVPVSVLTDEIRTDTATESPEARTGTIATDTRGVSPAIPEYGEESGMQVIPLNLAAVKTEQKIKPYYPDKQAARSIIEALRVGIVPRHKTEDFSCGREAESEIIETWMQDEEKACMFLNGDYGSGKSHMLEIIAAKALKDNWAIATIELDPDELPFFLPKRIYCQIMKTLRYHDPELGFNELITSVMNTEKKQIADILCEHPFMGDLFSAWQNAPEYSEDSFHYDRTKLCNWIAGEDVTISGFPLLKDQQTAANVYCNLISVIGWCAKKILGLEGLLILIDEGEGVDRRLYTPAHFKKSENFLKGLLLMAYSNPVLLEEFDYMIKEAIPRGRRDGEFTGLYYGGTKKSTSSFIWQDTSYVKLLFALTPGIVPVIREQIIRDPEINVKITEIELEELKEEYLEELYGKITSIYNTAYEISSSDSVYQYLVKNQTRLFVKSAVEAMDIMRFNPTTYHQELHTAISQRINFN